MKKTIGGKARALVELKRVEHAPAGPSKKLQIQVPDDHSPEMKRLEAVERLGDLVHPGRDVASPILRYQIEHRGPGLSLQLQRLQVLKPPA